MTLVIAVFLAAGAIVVKIFFTLLGVEAKARVPELCDWMIRTAARGHPADTRDAMVEECRRHQFDLCEKPLSALVYSTGLLLDGVRLRQAERARGLPERLARLTRRLRAIEARLLPHGLFDVIRQVVLFAVAFYTYRLVRSLVGRQVLDLPFYDGVVLLVAAGAVGVFVAVYRRPRSRRNR